MQENVATFESGIREEPPAIRGWLLFYCAVNCVIGPVYYGYHFWFGNAVARAISLADVFAGLLAGALILRRSPQAFFGIGFDFGVRFFHCLLMAAYWFSYPAQYASFRGRLIAIITVGLAWIISWFFYFRRSERVYRIFGRNL